MRETLFRWTILIIGVVLLGCFNPFAPKLEDAGRPDLIITEQLTPAQALQNFQYSYVFKDSILYAQLLDSSFVFIYFDPDQEPSGRFVSWGRDVDLRTTGRLFRNFNIIDLVWNSTILDTIYESNGVMQAESIRSFNLSLIRANETINIKGMAIFNLKKASLDNKWRITLWKDESDL
ncbi:MAG: hypothetical protein ONB13_03610 [candidate division KSB1 bacterium]|nr:hypothetical protein [candidate division KSB1 bacterium]MDZ7333522.1 hypothetical protein [candidate division KSB1 bacterium]MDZ7356726.1 hypothetical protein [candidate division KSB1 bacterium]MDZ7375686.1 hypothetical protein [candidate division KSB1 bacterium]MDZ7398636.1 hypothetical protein [candidate division KSB1 bacterium]